MKLMEFTVEYKNGEYIARSIVRHPWHRTVKVQVGASKSMEEAVGCVALAAQGVYSYLRKGKDPEGVEDIRPIMKGGIG